MTITQHHDRRAHQSAAPEPQSSERGRPIVLLGDNLDCLGPFQSLPGVTTAPRGTSIRGRPTAAVIGMDLSAVTDRTELGAKLRAQAPFCANLCAKTPSIKRLFLIIEGLTAVPGSVLQRMCESVEDRIHRNIEQYCGTYVILTILLVTGCDNPNLLAHRIHDRALQPRGIDATMTLPWEAIKKEPIKLTAANYYV